MKGFHLSPFGSIFVDFRRMFRRILLEPPATKAQKRNLKKESRDLHRASWLLRGAIVSYCSHVFRNDFRTLHVQFFSIAYPQAHLVRKYHNGLQLLDSFGERVASVLQLLGGMWHQELFS